jgi:hypothetical protein
MLKRQTELPELDFSPGLETDETPPLLSLE